MQTRRLIILFLFIHLSGFSFAQQSDAPRLKGDTSTVDPSYAKRRANRAALYSAILPGLGQAYNKKYWKIPVLYAGLFGLGAAIKFNNEYYHDFKDAYIIRTDGDSSTVDKYADIYPDENTLLSQQNYYRRSRDLMYIFISVVYVLNIIDAYVDSHLADFDISDNLSLNISPVMQFTTDKKPTTSLSLCLSFH